MKFKFENKYIKWGVTAFLVIAASISFYYLVFHISDIMKNINSILNVFTPVICALIVAYLLTPILNYVERKILNPLFDFMKIRRTARRNKWVRAIGIFLSISLVFIGVYCLIAMFISQIVPSVRTIIDNFDQYVTGFMDWLNKILDKNKDIKDTVLPFIDKASIEMEEWLDDTATLMEKSGEILKTVSLSIIGFLKATWNFILGIIISIYLLASKETFSAQGKKVIYSVFERHSANKMLRALRFMHKTFIGFFGGKIVDSIIIGLLCFIGTTLLRTPYAALVSLIVGVTNIIPFFGPFLGAIPSILLILIVDITNPLNSVYFAIFVLFLQQLDGNVIGPKILGDSTGLSSFWVIFAITVFGGFFGIPGIIVGVPIFAIIYAAVRYQVNHSLRKKNYPQDTTAYEEMQSIDPHGAFRLQTDPIHIDVEEEQVHKESVFKRLFGKKDSDEVDVNSETNDNSEKKDTLDKKEAELSDCENNNNSKKP